MRTSNPTIEKSMESFPLKLELDNGVGLSVLVPDDAQVIVDLLKENDDIKEHVGWLHDIETVDEIRERIGQFRDGKRLRYAITLNNVIVGYVGLMLHMDSEFENEGELGYFLDEDARGKGFAVKSVEALIVQAKEKLLLKSLRMFIEDDNEASIRVAEALKFERTEDLRENLYGKMERRYVKDV